MKGTFFLFESSVLFCMLNVPFREIRIIRNWFSHAKASFGNTEFRETTSLFSLNLKLVSQEILENCVGKKCERESTLSVTQQEVLTYRLLSRRSSPIRDSAGGPHLSVAQQEVLTYP